MCIRSSTITAEPCSCLAEPKNPAVRVWTRIVEEGLLSLLDDIIYVGSLRYQAAVVFQPRIPRSNCWDRRLSSVRLTQVVAAPCQPNGFGPRHPGTNIPRHLLVNIKVTRAASPAAWFTVRVCSQIDHAYPCIKSFQPETSPRPLLASGHFTLILRFHHREITPGWTHVRDHDGAGGVSGWDI